MINKISQRDNMKGAEPQPTNMFPLMCINRLSVRVKGSKFCIVMLPILASKIDLS